MRLTKDVSLVGGGSISGFGISAGVDSHVYLINGGTELALIDCGMATDCAFTRILTNIREDGYDAAHIKRLLLTHYHADHAGGAARFRSTLDLAVVASETACIPIERADAVATGLEAAQKVGIFAADYRLEPCRTDEAVRDGSRLRVGTLVVEAIETPGHCAGHVSYLVTGGEQAYLLAGDCIFCGGKILLQSVPDCDLQQSIKSIRKLASLDFQALLPGHGPIDLEGGPTHVHLALSAIDRLQVPANLV